MHIPKRDIGSWSYQLIQDCSVSLTERIQRGGVYRSLFLTGSEDGDPQTYNKTFSYTEKLSANLFSPVDLTYGIRVPRGSGPDEIAKARSAAFELNAQVRGSDMDEWLAEAVTWSLIKGKVLVKLIWDPEEEELDCYLVQPEFFGVLREDVSKLERQEAFFHSTYMTLDEFERRIQDHEDRKLLMQRAKQYVKASATGDQPDRDTILKQIILGGTNPLQIAGQGSPNNSRGVVNWLGGPAPVFSARTMANIIRLDELWVWDTPRGDYTTIQLVGPDCVVEGRGRQRNIFAQDATTDPTLKDVDNPLRGLHPYVEICVNQLPDYFWGRSELINIAMAQKTLNRRVDGINKMLRKQEDPPRFFKNSSSINELAWARLNQPGGWLNDNSPNATVENLAPEIPDGLYESMHESVGVFEDMADNPPVMAGRGESGVRAQGHAEVLTRNASPRLKKRAVKVERQVAATGALAFAILQAKDPTKYLAWLPAPEAGIQASLPPSNPIEQPPAPEMKSIEFILRQVHERATVHVDSHSSSPVFAAEERGLVFDMLRAQMITPQQALMLLHPPNEDELVSEAERRAFEQAKAQAEAVKNDPQAFLKSISGGKKK
jgi:hypothetical protein